MSELDINLVTTTIKIDARYVESLPYKNNWEDVGITSVSFIIRDITAGTTGPTRTATRSGDFYTTTLSLNPENEYGVTVRVTNSRGTVLSEETVFETDDITTYDNIDIIVDVNLEGRVVPIKGAKLYLYAITDVTRETPIYFGNGGVLDARSSTENGRVWVQRVERGTYLYKITATGYNDLTGTILATNTGNWVAGANGSVTMTPAT
jgi:hypothetical protein